MSPAIKPAPFLERAKNEPIGSAEFRQSTDEEFMPEPSSPLVPAQPLNAAVSTQALTSSAKRTQWAKMQGAEMAKDMLSIVTVANEGQTHCPKV